MAEYNYNAAYFANGMTGWHGASFPVISKCLAEELEAVETILDLGCGDGFYGQALAERAHFVDGADISPSILTHHNRRHYRDIKVADLGAPMSGSEAGGEYDVVFSSEVIEHVENYRAFLDNAFAMLKPGGKLFLTTTTFSCALPILLQTQPRDFLGMAACWEFVAGWFGSERHRTKFTARLWGWTKGHYHGFSKGQLRRALAEVGFENIRTDYLHIMPTIHTDFFDNPFKSLPFRGMVRIGMRCSKLGAQAVNYACRAFDIYAPNVLVVATKPINKAPLR
jgi:SAM-dependent methyltransferase